MSGFTSWYVQVQKRKSHMLYDISRLPLQAEALEHLQQDADLPVRLSL